MIIPSRACEFCNGIAEMIQYDKKYKANQLLQNITFKCNKCHREYIDKYCNGINIFPFAIKHPNMNIQQTKLHMYTTKDVVTKQITQFDIDEFVTFMEKHKPNELFHQEYSTTKPCWHIAGYGKSKGVTTIKVYADNSSNKNPKEMTLLSFFNSIKFEGIASIYVTL